LLVSPAGGARGSSGFLLEELFPFRANSALAVAVLRGTETMEVEDTSSSPGAGYAPPMSELSLIRRLLGGCCTMTMSSPPFGDVGGTIFGTMTLLFASISFIFGPSHHR
jgi:hypothetical protein